MITKIGVNCNILNRAKYNSILGVLFEYFRGEYNGKHKTMGRNNRISVIPL